MTEEKEVQISLRLPEQLKHRIQKVAKPTTHSMNAEIVNRLYDSFSVSKEGYAKNINELNSFYAQHIKSDRMKALGERLSFALAQYNEARHIVHLAPLITPAQLAKAMGYEYADNVERYFQGSLEASFSELTQFASYLGCSDEWLSFGDPFKPYPSLSYSLTTGDVNDLANFCAEPLKTPTATMTIKNLYVVRNKDDGRILLVKHYANDVCQVFKTNLNLSAHVGASGTASRNALVMLLAALLHSQFLIGLKAYLVADDLFSELANKGEHHPLLLLGNHATSNWDQYIWDFSANGASNEYWQGWHEVRRDIEHYIVSDSTLNESYKAILARNHPVIKTINAMYVP